MTPQNSSLTARHLAPPALILCIALPWSLLLLLAPIARADLKKGQEIFEHRCTGCHRLDEARIGPPLRGVFGRVAASDPHFFYSTALKASHIKWDEATLDRWLTDPDGLVPDVDMEFRLNSASERAEIIAYLKSLSAH